MIVALAGRRIDPVPPPPRPTFPLGRVETVRAAIRRRFVELRASALVCSAACGADLIALEVARDLDASGTLPVRRRIVLPFSPDTFRTTSVADRPGEWVRDYDALVEDAGRRGDLVVLADLSPGDDAYLAANQAILDEAVRLAGEGGISNVRALVAWNGPRAAGPDATAAFRGAAKRMGIAVEEIPTL